MPKWELVEGDNLAALRAMPSDSFDAIVTDPPGGLNFMNREWDSDRGGRDSWIVWMTERAKEMLRVLKPGGYAIVWALPRTSHWTAIALEDAGFELRDRGLFAFGSGFPKSHSIANDIDKLLGQPPRGRAIPTASTHLPDGKYVEEKLTSNPVEPYEPRTPEGKRHAGKGTALKPAIEDWHICRKPISESTVAANVLKHGTGAMNIDACRIQVDDGGYVINRWDDGAKPFGGGAGHEYTSSTEMRGRWPAHLTLQHADECQLVGTTKVKGSRIDKPCPAPEINGHKWGTLQGNRGSRGIGDENGEEKIEIYACVPWCPVRMLDDQAGRKKSGMMKAGQQRKATLGGGGYNGDMPDEATSRGSYGDSGPVSRFFAVFPPGVTLEPLCPICNLPLGLSCASIPVCAANSVMQSFSRRQTDNGSARVAALQSGQHVNEGKSEGSTGLVDIAESTFRSLPEITKSTVPQSVVIEPTEQFVLCVKSAGDLCDSCATVIARSLVATKQGLAMESVAGWDSISEPRRQILIRSLASFADLQVGIDITKATKSLNVFFGFVRDAMRRSIRIEETEIGLDRQSRLFYSSKASRSERELGLRGVVPCAKCGGLDSVEHKFSSGKVEKCIRNNHPTVKSLALMQWLCRLVTPLGGRILDPFAGSGSTGVAAMKEGFEFVGVEQDARSVLIARARITHAAAGSGGRKEDER